jgi:hypothetical protein
LNGVHAIEPAKKTAKQVWILFIRRRIARVGRGIDARQAMKQLAERWRFGQNVSEHDRFGLQKNAHRHRIAWIRRRA